MSESYSASYAAAGVDVTAGYEAVKRIKPMVESTYIPGVMGTLGGFGGMFVAVCLMFFAYSTILGWSLYGTRCTEYLLGLKATKVYQVIFSLITSENTRSLGFHKAIGYQESFICRRCGLKFGRWLDVHWLEKRCNSPKTPSMHPISWREIVENDGKLKNGAAYMALKTGAKVVPIGIVGPAKPFTKNAII